MNTINSITQHFTFELSDGADIQYIIPKKDIKDKVDLVFRKYINLPNTEKPIRLDLPEPHQELTYEDILAYYAIDYFSVMEMSHSEEPVQIAKHINSWIGMDWIMYKQEFLKKWRNIKKLRIYVSCEGYDKQTLLNTWQPSLSNMGHYTIGLDGPVVKPASELSIISSMNVILYYSSKNEGIIAGSILSGIPIIGIKPFQQTRPYHELVTTIMDREEVLEYIEAISRAWIN